MKQLLVLTDFTANSAHAAITAARLCEKLNTDLLLYHSVAYVPIITDYTYGAYIPDTAEALSEESKTRLNKEVEILQSLPHQNPDHYPKINYESGEGNLENNIKALTAKSDISFVVMGGRSGGGLDHFLSGSETTAVIKESNRPVLIIPEKADLSHLKTVVFATDFSTSDVPAMNFLLEMSQRLGFHIEVVHVLQPGQKNNRIEAEVTFREYLEGLQQPQISYRNIYGIHAGPRLQDYCEETGAALLAMTRGHHNLISQLFGKSETKGVVTNQHTCALIFPPAFTDQEK